MRALVATPGGRLRWRDVASPALPGPGGALVRPVAVATCDVDRPLMLGRTQFPLPLVLGHECVAEIVEVGAQVTSLRVGQRVVVPYQISCGTCQPCRTGHTGSCTSVPPVSMYGFGLAGGLWGGMIADQVAVPYAEAMLVPVPESVDLLAAVSVGDSVGVGYHQIAPHLPRLLAEDANARVLLVGGLDDRPVLTPSAALHAGQIALALGAREVTLVDSRPGVRTVASSLGIDTIDARGRSAWPTAALAVDATGSASGLRRTIAHTAPDGVCSSVGGFHRQVRLPFLQSYSRNLTLHVGRSHARTVIPEILALIGSGRLRPGEVVSDIAALDHAPRALQAHHRHDAITTVLTR